MPSAFGACLSSFREADTQRPTDSGRALSRRKLAAQFRDEPCQCWSTPAPRGRGPRGKPAPHRHAGLSAYGSGIRKRSDSVKHSSRKPPDCLRRATVRKRMEMEKIAEQMDAMFNSCSAGNMILTSFAVHSYRCKSISESPSALVASTEPRH